MSGVSEALATLQKDGVEVITLVFTDVLGRLKGFNLSVNEIERAFSEGIVFDGSSVEGFVRIEESDLIAMPDPGAVFVAPAQVSGFKTAFIVCDVLRVDGRPFERDPRHVLKRALAQIQKQGYQYYVGPELEYFYFGSDSTPTLLDDAGYFDTLPSYRPTLAREETVKVLREMGIEVEASHHEVAPSQHEIDFRYRDALRMADILQISKMIIKEVARKYELYASFMPKPIFGVNGSGMHLHMSLWRGDENLFYDPRDPYQLSTLARHFLGGLLTYVKYIALVTNQWVNSYKRLVVGYEAPVYISWGRFNRSALVRVPAFKKPASARLEFRAPDPGANPYLAFACVLTAGMRGITERLVPPEPVEMDIYHMPEADRQRRNIDTLPASLLEAIDLACQSPILAEALGEPLFEKIIENKRVEWDKFRMAVTDYEIQTYYRML
jgi:glutamine synthetase